MGLKIIFFNRSFYPDITATSQLLGELCEDLVKDYNCQITVITGRPLIRHSSNINDNFEKMNIIRLNNTVFSTHSFLGRIFNYLTYFFLSFIACFKLSKPDLVVSLTDPPIIGLLGLWVRFRFKIPLVISVRDLFPEAARGLEGSNHKILDFLLDRLIRFYLRHANHVVVLGKLMQRRIIEKGIIPDKVSIISDWADSMKIFPRGKKNRFSIDYNLSDFFVVMYSGNMGASSGLQTLIRAAHLLKDYKDILFVLIGEGIIKDELVASVKSYNLENTRFFPYQPQDILSHSFSSADIFIVSLKKGLAGYSLPSKIYSILASGRPYIACVEEESEIAYISRQYNCGILAEPQDHYDLAEKILFFYHNKGLIPEMGENARKAALVFERRLGSKAYNELFKKLLAEQKGV